VTGRHHGRSARAGAVIASLALVSLAVLGVVLAAAAPAASADPLGSAKAHAAALAATVTRLRTQAEVASQRYDGIESRLSQAVSSQLDAEQSLDAVTAHADAARADVSGRIQALYESGGDAGVLASVLTGQDPTEVLDRYQLASDVITFESQHATDAGAAVASARAVAVRAGTSARSVTRLQVAAGAAATAVQAALATEHAELTAAQAGVRRLAAADQAAAAAASQRDFVAAVSQAGGDLTTVATAAPSPAAATAIAAARTRLGNPYVWGATGPDAFDCSGLTQWSYAHAGIALPRVAAAQWNSGPHPTLSQLEPGDLLFWATDTSNPATIHHVALYVGGGMMIAAPHTGENVQVQPVYMTGFIGATRPWAPAG
jgi:cell wall-associated NlpC family hydrolase